MSGNKRTSSTIEIVNQEIDPETGKKMDTEITINDNFWVSGQEFDEFEE